MKHVFCGNLFDSLAYLRNLVSKYERCKVGSIVIDNVVLYFADLHSFYFELDQIFIKNLYGFRTEEQSPVIVDCGAHVGLASLYFARRYPRSEIHAFEADPDIHRLFQSNIQSAKLNNVTSHAKAVWADNNGVCFRLSGDDSGHISNTDGTIIPSIRLRDYLEQFERIDMLKLDVEGAEFEIIEDCLPVLSRVQRMIIEVHRLSDDNKSLANFLRCLEKSGFQFVLSDIHSASWAQVDHIPPFDFVAHDKYIVSVFAWRPIYDQTKSNSKTIRPSGKPNIVQFCMQDYGGAGTAALRLHDGLLSSGVNSLFFVHNIQRWKPGTIPLFAKSCSAPIPHKKIVSSDWKAFQAHSQRLISKYPQRPQGLEIFTDTWAATKLSNVPEIAEADIIHLHWIAGTVDIPREVEFLKTKKIVWTLHDMNAFTGGCHYAAGCQKYEQQCGGCPQLGSSRDNDLSRQIWTRKMAAYKQLDITIVALCQWMADCVKISSLLSSFPVHVIPNGLPTNIFKPYPQAQIRKSLQVPKDAFVILFGADSVTNARKGFVYLLRALEHVKTQFPSEHIALATFGNHAQAAVQHLGFPTFAFDYVDKESELALVYSMADVTVIPSLEDNLPNVVLESLACGTPVVGFDVGGIPDMVEHLVNGYLSPVGDENGLAGGMRWIMEQKKAGSKIRTKCRETALSRYNFPLQAGRYRELYEENLKNTRVKYFQVNKKKDFVHSTCQSNTHVSQLQLDEFLSLRFLHEHHDYHAQGSKCIYQDLIKNSFTVREIIHKIQNDRKYLDRNQYDHDVRLKNDHMNHYINCIKYGFRKEVKGWRETNSVDLVNPDYYIQKEEITDKEIGEYLQQNPLEIKNQIIVDGIHRSMCMIGRILNGKSYIPFFYIGDKNISPQKQIIPNVGYRKEHNKYRWDAIVPHIDKDCFKVLDIGSNYGYFSLSLASHYPNAQIFSIEGEFGTGNQESKGLKIHHSIKNDHFIYNNFIYNTLLTDDLVKLFNEKSIVFDYQISFSVFHWIVYLKYANNGSSQNIKKMFVDQLKMAKTTFLELPSFGQQTSMSPYYADHDSFDHLFSELNRELPLEFEKIGECNWYGKRDLFHIKLLDCKPSNFTVNDVNRILANK
ncbi:FkbM family methyltransferase [Desulfonatronum sp. SC1]|uniref:FkbM family methyltransferase n=1 Tax=Desulfonatronum sp. SC1 TaxID=2109626 RepID=UPI000D30B465|nr:FkbM family methyltransferase [Desulfonatronum sp. SC1]PTN34155.1 hypothetical protein C6366_13515 [Desulfonatronum sp. SC1]